MAPVATSSTTRKLRCARCAMDMFQPPSGETWFEFASLLISKFLSLLSFFHYLTPICYLLTIIFFTCFFIETFLSVVPIS
jgi:hypothetical protein